MATADQSLLDQIQRLSGALRRARDGGTGKPTDSLNHSYSSSAYQYSRGRGRHESKFVPPRQIRVAPKSVEIGGQVFTASNNKLTRQTTTSLSSSTTSITEQPPQIHPRQRFIPPRGRHPKQYTGARVYKPKTSRKHANLSLVLNKPNRLAKKTKQCPFFTRTGICSRGKSCRYQHDSKKVAICPRYLTGDCPQSAETCLLSHEATLNRVPPCIHFQNNGRCKNGDQCIYPHVRFGVKNSVCRDFAVLGYCEKGIDCENSHVRECPDFVETGACKNSRCKLPHVIRANHKHTNNTNQSGTQSAVSKVAQKTENDRVPGDKNELAKAENDSADPSNSDNKQLPNNGVEYTFEGGDEYIPLTFIESDEDEESDDDLEGSEQDDEDQPSDTKEEEGEEMRVFG